MVPGTDESGEYTSAQPRSEGKSPIASRPEITKSHSKSGDDTPPGNRHDMPTIAIGSPDTNGDEETAEPFSRKRISAAGVG
ncbi:hypothetical protein Lesp02_13160 [Lentzea sp. NBRC 105346]|nr:hypothetical protein Lesp02_13160 [Lentzea sp. NBRC 105346]